MDFQVIWELLGSPVVGNLFLLAAAVVGVLGSYLLYLKKRREKRQKVRLALKTELEAMTPIENWDNENIPAQKIGSDLIYKSNAQDLGLLTDEEVHLITETYTQLDIVQSLIDDYLEISVSVRLELGEVDTSQGHLEIAIKNQFKRLFATRWQTLQVLKKHLNEDYRDHELMDLSLNEGDRLTNGHPIIENFGEAMLEDGHIERVDDDGFRVTKKGEENFLIEVE